MILKGQCPVERIEGQDGVLGVLSFQSFALQWSFKGTAKNKIKYNLIHCLNNILSSFPVSLFLNILDKIFRSVMGLILNFYLLENVSIIIKKNLFCTDIKRRKTLPLKAAINFFLHSFL